MPNKNQISDKQLTANRSNAQKGGVKTQAGKMASRLNASKHGGLSNIVVDAELPAYNAIHAELSDEYEPSRFVQKILVERIALCVLQMRRISFAVSEYLLQIEDPEISKSVFAVLEEKQVISPGYRPAITTGQIERIMDIYQRYQVSVENRFLKLTKELAAANLGKS